MTKTFFIILILVLSLSPLLTLAACPPTCFPIVQPCTGPSGNCSIGDFLGLILRVAGFLVFNVMPYVAVLMLILGGVIFLFAGGSPELKSWGKRIIFTAVIGLALGLLSYAIVRAILTGLGYKHGIPF